MKIFVAKLPYQFKEADIEELFTPYGEVSSVNLVMDRETGRSKCYAFVEMPNEAAAATAITSLDQKQILDKALAVSQAKEREKPAGGGGGYRSGGGGGYRGGNSGGGYGGNSSGNYRDSSNGGGGNYRDRGNSNGGGNYRDRGNSNGGGSYRDRGNKGQSDDY